jgi:hypothetical protein
VILEPGEGEFHDRTVEAWATFSPRGRIDPPLPACGERVGVPLTLTLFPLKSGERRHGRSRSRVTATARRRGSARRAR